MEVTNISSELPSKFGNTDAAGKNEEKPDQSIPEVPVSVHNEKVDGQTEGVQVSELDGTYFAEVSGPPAVSTSAESLSGAEDRLAYLVNLFA